MNQFRAQAAVFGRKPKRFGSSDHRCNRGFCLDKADRILAAMTGGKMGWIRQESAAAPDNAGKRLTRFAMESDV
jgi:hypothetical protein